MRKKNFVTLIEAFSTIAGELPEWNLFIYGEGELRNDLEKMLHKQNLQKKVFLPGIVDDMKEIYKRAEIFVSSSHYESFGLAAAEAMAFGVPCIGFRNCPGISEIVLHNQNGLLADGIDNPVSLSVQMRYLAENETKRNALGQHAHLFVQKFSIESIAKQWKELIYSTALRTP